MAFKSNLDFYGLNKNPAEGEKFAKAERAAVFRATGGDFLRFLTENINKYPEICGTMQPFLWVPWGTWMCPKKQVFLSPILCNSVRKYFLFRQNGAPRVVKDLKERSPWNWGIFFVKAKKEIEERKATVCPLNIELKDTLTLFREIVYVDPRVLWFGCKKKGSG